MSSRQRASGSSRVWSRGACALVAALTLVACPRPPPISSDAGFTAPVVVPEKDAGVVVVVPDAGLTWPEKYAGEACPAEAFGRAVGPDGGVYDVPDGSIQFGLCVALRGVAGQALLDGAPAVGPVRLRFTAGDYGSEIDRSIDSLGGYSARAMRAYYDIFQYQPSGVFSTYQGFKELGPIDLSVDQKRDLVTTTHAIHGTAQFAGVPFAGTNAPNDVFLTAYGTNPLAQTVSTMSQHGAFEVRLVEGDIALLLDAPARALFGTDLIAYRLDNGRLTLDRDLPLDINLGAKLVEGEITLDGRPFPNRVPGPDFNLEFVRPGESDPSVRTHHEGGVAAFSGLVPTGQYAVTLNFERSPDRQLPSWVFNQQLASQLDVTKTDARVSKNFVSWRVEGGLLIDGRPVRPNPNYTWAMFMYGFAGSSTTQSGLLYEVPLEAASFDLRIFDGNYFTILSIDEHFADDLVNGYYIVDRYLQVHENRSLPINLETATLTGKLSIDGAAPPAGQVAGQLWFRNRALEGQNSWFRKRVVTSEDGEFRARLPKGEYEIYFLIDRNTYPEYATGRQLLVSRVVLDGPATVDLAYTTKLVTGPIRLGGEVVPDEVPGEEVGVVLSSDDGRQFTWGFNGGAPNYRLRVPQGEYDLDFVINQNAIAGVAWGTAPFGQRMSTKRVGDPVNAGQ